MRGSICRRSRETPAACCSPGSRRGRPSSVAPCSARRAVGSARSELGPCRDPTLPERDIVRLCASWHPHQTLSLRSRMLLRGTELMVSDANQHYDRCLEVARTVGARSDPGGGTARELSQYGTAVTGAIPDVRFRPESMGTKRASSDAVNDGEGQWVFNIRYPARVAATRFAEPGIGAASVPRRRGR